MLGLILIYFIGKRFYDLAENFNRHRWGFAILGVVSYYVGTFVAGVLITIIGFAMESDFVLEESNSFALGLIAMPFGLALCVGLYYMLQYFWKRDGVKAELDLEEIGKNRID